MYLCSTPYAPGREHCVHSLDPELGIALPLGRPARRPSPVGQRGRWPTLDETLLSGALPTYDDCAAYSSDCVPRLSKLTRHSVRFQGQR